MPNTPVKIHNAQLMQSIETLKLDDSFTATTGASTSQTIATLIGEALPADVETVIILNASGNTLHVANGTASATKGSVYTDNGISLSGTKTDLDAIQLFTVGAESLSVFVYIPR